MVSRAGAFDRCRALRKRRKHWRHRYTSLHRIFGCALRMATCLRVHWYPRPDLGPLVEIFVPSRQFSSQAVSTGTCLHRAEPDQSRTAAEVGLIAIVIFAASHVLGCISQSFRGGARLLVLFDLVASVLKPDPRRFTDEYRLSPHDPLSDTRPRVYGWRLDRFQVDKTWLVVEPRKEDCDGDTCRSDVGRNTGCLSAVDC